MITMLNTDCMDYMATLPDKALELAIVDPPYGIGEDGGKIRARKKDNWYMTTRQNVSARGFKKWDRERPTAEYFKELFRVSQNQIIWGANYYPQHLRPSMGWIFWDKKLGGDFSDGELAYTSFERALKIYTQHNNHHGKIHPTAKPVALYKWLLSRYAKPGDRILDTHGGSGSICIACHDLGYDLTWMELDPDYYAAAVKRYQTHAAQGQLFDPTPPKPINQGELL